jgi:hypothetical protein
MSHVPGVNSVLTDTLSRMDTAGDYELRPDVFRDGTRARGSNPTIDLFASRYNHKLARFAALPDTEGQLILTHSTYVGGKCGALDGVKSLYYPLENDYLGATTVAAERLVQHAVRLSCKSSAGYINHGRLQNSLGSRARLWRPIVHFRWTLLDRGRLDFLEPEGDDSGAASSALLPPYNHSIEHQSESVRTDNMVAV